MERGAPDSNIWCPAYHVCNLQEKGDQKSDEHVEPFQDTGNSDSSSTVKSLLSESSLLFLVATSSLGHLGRM